MRACGSVGGERTAMLAALLCVAVAAGGAWAVEDHAAAEAAGTAAAPSEEPPPAPPQPPGAEAEDGAEAEPALEGPNVCTRNETRMVKVTAFEVFPVTVQTYTWCVRVPPRCAKNKTEMRRKRVEHMVPKWRLVQECCQGFHSQPASAQSAAQRCVPECPLGCAHGVCAEPHRCDCAAGYSGLRCDSPCPDGTWGVDCAGNCTCSEHGACDGRTGACACAAGWRGERCHRPCAHGSWGEGCSRRCPPCANPSVSCDPERGACPGGLASPPPPTPAAAAAAAAAAAVATPPPAPAAVPAPAAHALDGGLNELDAAAAASAEGRSAAAVVLQPPCEHSECPETGGWEPVQRLTQDPPSVGHTDPPRRSNDLDTAALETEPPSVDDAGDANDADGDSDEAVDADGDHTTSYPDPGPHTDPTVTTVEPRPALAPASAPVVVEPEVPEKELDVQRKKAADAKKARAKDQRPREKLPMKESDLSDTADELPTVKPTTESPSGFALPPNLTPAHWPRVPDSNPEDSPPPASAWWPQPAPANNIAPDLKPQDVASLKDQSSGPPPAPAPPHEGASGGGFRLSTWEVAAGAALLGALLVGVASLAMARCGCGRLGPKVRRGEEGAAGVDAVELRALAGRPLAPTDAAVAGDDAATLTAVRPLFFSPLYLPAAAASPPELASPADGPGALPGAAPGVGVGVGVGGATTPGATGGLVLTALFSAPAPAHLQQLCSLPTHELLRESLSAHYDVPPTLLRRPTLSAADRRASLPAAPAAPTAASAGPLGPGALSWAPDPPPNPSLYLSPPPPAPAPILATSLTPASGPCTATHESLFAPATLLAATANADHVYEELPCWPRIH